MSCVGTQPMGALVPSDCLSGTVETRSGGAAALFDLTFGTAITKEGIGRFSNVPLAPHRGRV